jgi:signal transduction histidine kinase/ligand-binding sensor domain-containing protein
MVFVMAMQVSSPPVFAADVAGMSLRHPAISMLHARWLVKDGAPPGISKMLQTPDGWIWIASTAGLFRFDGTRFMKYQAPPGINLPSNIGAMGVFKDGTMWIAPAFGGLFFLQGTALQEFTQRDNLPIDAVQDVVRDASGRIWLASGMGLRVLGANGRTWREAGTEVGLPQVPILRMLVDSRGTMWAQGPTANFARWPGKKQFVKVSDQVGLGQLREAPDGTIWASDLGHAGLRRLSILHDDPRHSIFMQDVRCRQFTIDRHGNIWYMVDGGIVRANIERETPRIETFTSQQGLSGQHGNVALEDREGNLWVATDSGLDQFRSARLTELVLPPYGNLARPLAAGPDGALWIDHVFLSSLGAVPKPFGPPSDASNVVTVLYRDPNGTLWSGGHDGLWHLDGLRRVKVQLPPELAKIPRLPIFSLAMDGEGALWMSIGPRGTWRLKDGVWAQHGGIPALARLPVTTIVTGKADMVWFASISNTLAILHGGAVKKFGAGQGIAIGAILQIVPHGHGAFLGGGDGLAYFNGERAVSIRGQGNELFSGATGLVLAPDGGLWANTALGLVEIVAAEVARALAQPGYQVRYRRYDENDGLLGGAAPLLPLPSMVRSSTGVLIVSTGSSTFQLDPMHAHANQILPPVHITGITADGAARAPTDAVRLQPAPDTVRIDYTALSMALPQRVRFQYLLDGVDREWQDAGTRRSAYYTRLSPGKYTFRVIAANDDGLWNSKGATLVFDIPPTLIQTIWFKLLCVAALLLLVWCLHRLRVRVVLRRQARAFDARVAERERIARDLHDTLLQSVQGLILMFRRIALRTPDNEPTKAQMNAALDLAIEVMEEGRDKVQGLRVAGRDSAGLGADLEIYGRRLSELHRAAFSFNQPYPARALHGAVLDEVLALGQEAIRNAFVHAQAGQIDVILEYGEKVLVLMVRDDGCGIDVSLQNGLAGHWGIAGMRERAQQLGAEFALSSAPGDGCLWRLQLGARLAYAQDPPVLPRMRPAESISP